MDTGVSIPGNATVEFALQSLHNERQSHAAGGLAGRGGRQLSAGRRGSRSGRWCRRLPRGAGQ